jgi:hypothetical protein
MVLDHHRCPDIERDACEGAAEVLGGHTDDCEAVFVQPSGLPHNVWVGAKAALPQSGPDDGYRMCIGLAILFRD